MRRVRHNNEAFYLTLKMHRKKHYASTIVMMHSTTTIFTTESTYLNKNNISRRWGSYNANNNYSQKCIKYKGKKHQKW